jgi:hypothetical protein
VTVGVGVDDGVSVGRGDTLGVGVGEISPVLVGVGVGVSVSTRVAVGVEVGVIVTVTVIVDVSVGVGVSVSAGIAVFVGVEVGGNHGSHSFCPAMMMLLTRQLACLIASTVVRWRCAREYRVSPRRTVYRCQPDGGTQGVGITVLVGVTPGGGTQIT